MSDKKLHAIMGSPRKGGNTAKMFLWAVQEERHELFHTSGMHKLSSIVFAETGGKTKAPDRIMNKIRRCW